jgi:hypothetical protein
MRRREENLIYWLAQSGTGSSRDAGFNLRGKIARWVLPWSVEARAEDTELCTGTVVRSAGSPWIEEGNVIDGLGKIGEKFLRPIAEAEKTANRLPTYTFARDVDLLNPAAARTKELSVETQTTIRGHEVLQAPETRDLTIRHFGMALRVRALNILQNSGTVSGGGVKFLLPEIGIHDQTRKMSVYPHSRTSLNVSELSSQVCDSFLREAEVSKGVPAQRSQLLAVFRNVPVALISKIRFLEQRGVILYTLIQTDDQSRTRVHDMAAVRDVEKNEVHLVAHRTRYRTAFLK